MKLVIDTSDSKGWQSRVLWPTIAKLDLKKITKIEVKTNPKSFTGSRVGVAIANALSYALKVPVNGKRADKLKIVDPVYD